MRWISIKRLFFWGFVREWNDWFDEIWNCVFHFAGIRVNIKRMDRTPSGEDQSLCNECSGGSADLPRSVSQYFCQLVRTRTWFDLYVSFTSRFTSQGFSLQSLSYNLFFGWKKIVLVSFKILSRIQKSLLKKKLVGAQGSNGMHLTERLSCSHDSPPLARYQSLSGVSSRRFWRT